MEHWSIRSFYFPDGSCGCSESSSTEERRRHVTLDGIAGAQGTTESIEAGTSSFLSLPLHLPSCGKSMVERDHHLLRGNLWQHMQ